MFDAHLVLAKPKHNSENGTCGSTDDIDFVAVPHNAVVGARGGHGRGGAPRHRLRLQDFHGIENLEKRRNFQKIPKSRHMAGCQAVNITNFTADDS